MDLEFWQDARASLLAVLEESPSGASALLEAIEAGTIDGSEEDAILRYFEPPASGEDLHIVASGVGSHLFDMPPIEAFVLPVRQSDTPETSDELNLIAQTLRDFAREQEFQFLSRLENGE